MSQKIALIVGAGTGISFSFARLLRESGYRVALASRNLQKLQPVADELEAEAFQVDVSSIESVQHLFAAVEHKLGHPNVVLFHPSTRIGGDITSVDINAVADAIQTNVVGAYAVAQEAAKRLVPLGEGAIFFTGATASVKAFANSSAFAVGKFAIRGLAQSLARELSPKGIHVAHFVIDGYVRSSHVDDEFNADNVAKSYLAVLNQPKGAWSWEIELRSFNETF